CITISRRITSGLKLWAVWSALVESFSFKTRYGSDLSRRIFTRCVLFASSSTIRIRRFSFAAEPRTGSGGAELTPTVRGKKSASNSFFTIYQCIRSSVALSCADPGNKPSSQQAQERTNQRAGNGKPEWNHFF